MKKLSTLSALILSLGLGVSAQAQQGPILGDAFVNIDSSNLSVFQFNSLDFGTISPIGQPGTVTIDPQGSTVASNVISTFEGFPGRWEVQGVPNAPIEISFPSSINLSNGVNSIRVDEFRTEFTNSDDVNETTLDASGLTTFNVGATLNVDGNQPSGSYFGQYQVTVVYN